MPGLESVDCLYDMIYALQVEIERLHRARKRGKVLINVNEKIILYCIITLGWRL
jgi:hypothetical protein